MITIPQHGPKGEVYDFNLFVSQVDELRLVARWRVWIEECRGEGATSIKNETKREAKVFLTSDLLKAYKGICQTIDGEFVGLNEGKEICRLLAVDSSFSEVSGSETLEARMVELYGTYRCGT